MHQTTTYCRLGIDEELVALLGRHSPVSDLGVSFSYGHETDPSY